MKLYSFKSQGLKWLAAPYQYVKKYRWFFQQIVSQNFQTLGGYKQVMKFMHIFEWLKEV